MNIYILILISSILVNNYLMSQFLGICPFLGVSKDTSTAFGMGMAVTFVMALASLMAYIIQEFLLIPLNLEYLQTIAFILVIAVLVQIVEMVLKKVSFS
ncbi:MAG: electron transport complex subunit RsxA, partial [Christensenellaceae bacterium]|nr:electron transport complex subunit RsxA [Christensenellaceae bacterium]